MKVLGITGGVGSGKSVVMEILKKDYDAALIYSDLVAHELMQKGGRNYKAIKAVFPAVLNQSKEIDRKKLGAIVFSDRAKLKILNDITHPNILEELKHRIYKIKTENKAAFIALEAALLIEPQYNCLYDELWYVYASQDIRIKRLQEGRAYSKEKCISMINSQKGEKEFEKNCQRKIDNSFGIEYTKAELKAALSQFLDKA